MRWMTLPLIMVVLAGLAYGFWPRGSASPSGGVEVAAVAAALGQEARGATGAALAKRVLAFPDDHGAHPAAPAEVWDISVILSDDARPELSLRLTLVRYALARRDASAGRDEDAAFGIEDQTANEWSTIRRASAFAADELLAGQLVIASDPSGPSITAERASRAALGLAGTDDLKGGGARVWLEHWELVREDDQLVRVRASGEDVELTLALSPSKMPVSMDEVVFAGASEDAATSLAGYSEPRFRVSGTVAVAGEVRELQGIGWLEHVWGNLAEALSGRRGQLVANRFRLQLDDGVDLSCLHLRRRGGGGTPIPRCLLINVDGDRAVLRRRDLRLTAGDGRWTSTSGVQYPLDWRLVIPGRDLELRIVPLLKDRAMALRTLAIGGGAGQTWSGAVRVSGWRGSDELGGLGYMDLSGYAEASTGT